MRPPTRTGTFPADGGERKPRAAHDTGRPADPCASGINHPFRIQDATRTIR
ncbi:MULTISPECIES: hypothetical protein [Protofrankia]|uniref:hypothetical protein n=1 Tax=Protofrankia TaxID=2994361 RepID=UPI000AB33E12|nr:MULTISPECIES: hypothetical protein [Protofrankia]